MIYGELSSLNSHAFDLFETCERFVDGHQVFIGSAHELFESIERHAYALARTLLRVPRPRVIDQDAAHLLRDSALRRCDELVDDRAG